MSHSCTQRTELKGLECGFLRGAARGPRQQLNSAERPAVAPRAPPDIGAERPHVRQRTEIFVEQPVELHRQRELPLQLGIRCEHPWIHLHVQRLRTCLATRREPDRVATRQDRGAARAQTTNGAVAGTSGSLHGGVRAASARGGGAFSA